MHPLTLDRPKVLCPVGGRPLIDHAIDRLRLVTGDVAVNVHRSQPTLREHLRALQDPPITVSMEDGARLGTAGPLGALRDWIDGRAVVLVNGDTWCPGGTDELVRGWDGESIRILVPGDAPFGPSARIAGALMAWNDVRRLEPVPSGLYEVLWRDADAEGRIETVHHHGPFVDCAGPADYLEANLQAAGTSVIGAGAHVEGTVEDSVVWPGARVYANEHLVRAIRTDTGRTVLIRT